MHSLLIQLLIARIDREFSPEEHKQILDVCLKEFPTYGDMLPYWKIERELEQAYEDLRARFDHPQNKFLHRQLVKGIVTGKAEPKDIPPDETPVDWQPRESLHVKIV